MNMLSITDIPVKTQGKFWEYANIASPDECWEWRRSKTPLGYGRLNIRGHTIYAHRISYVMTKSLILDGLCILHRCDNPSCINPFHLFLGTKKDNTHDMIIKHRHPLISFGGDREVPRIRHKRIYKKRNPGRKAKKLTKDQVQEIRTRFIPGNNIRVLSCEYKVSRRAIYDIVNQKSWRWLEDGQ